MSSLEGVHMTRWKWGGLLLRKTREMETCEHLVVSEQAQRENKTLFFIDQHLHISSRRQFSSDNLDEISGLKFWKVYCWLWREKKKSLSHVRPFATPWTVCGLPGSSVHGILQAIILEWIAILSSSRFSQCRDRTWVSRFADRFFTIWATKEGHCSL